jgi:hypothetical protein
VSIDLAERIDDLILATAACCSQAVHDHIEDALDAAQRGDADAAERSLMAARALMDDENKRPGEEWWRRC